VLYVFLISHSLFYLDLALPTQVGTAKKVRRKSEAGIKTITTFKVD